MWPRAIVTVASAVDGLLAAVVGAILWFALGGSGADASSSDVDVAVGVGSVDISVAF